jgi:hypothetical protein
MRRAILVAVALSCFVGKGMAADFQQAWQMVAGLTSGDFAKKDAALIIFHRIVVAGWPSSDCHVLES